MNEEEMRYRVTAEYKSVHQLIIEATSPEEAEYFAPHSCHYFTFN